MVTVDSSPRVLLICTDPHLGLALEQELINRQCVLERAFNNAEGLKRVRCAPYDVVITDPATTIEDDLALFRRTPLLSAEDESDRPGARGHVRRHTLSPSAGCLLL